MEIKDKIARLKIFNLDRGVKKKTVILRVLESP